MRSWPLSFYHFGIGRGRVVSAGHVALRHTQSYEKNPGPPGQREVYRNCGIAL